MARMSKEPLTQEQVDAIVLPHGGVRTTRNTISNYLARAPYFWNGMRGRACCVHVWTEPRDVRGHRCSKIAAVTETVEGQGEIDFCAFHSSVQEGRRAARQKARDDEARAKREAYWAAQRAKNDAVGLVEVYRAALQKIADGDNDARGVARAALGIETPAEERY